MLRKTAGETTPDYHARLLFELRRRSSQLIARLNPFDQSHRLARLVGPAGVWPQLQQYQFNALTRLGLKPHHSIVDIGCGPITVGLKLISYLEHGNYVGVDLLHEPLVEAHRRIAQHDLTHKNPLLVCSTTFGKRELAGRTFDFIWMSQLSYHLDDLQLVLLFDQARAMMHSSSVLLLDVIDPHLRLESDDRWRGFSYHLRPVEAYEALAREFSLVVRRKGTLRDYGYPDKINLSRNTLLEFRKADGPLTPELTETIGHDDRACACRPVALAMIGLWPAVGYGRLAARSRRWCA